MKALVKTEKGVGNVTLINDYPKPHAKPGWVIVEVFGCGICGTDLHILENTHKNWPPVVLGHEYTGRIVEVGEGVESWQVGDRVVCEQHHGACGKCDVCRRGAVHLCTEKRSPGWGIDGAFAEYVALPAFYLHKVPAGVSFLKASITEPTAICITGLDRVAILPGEKVVVVGPGPIGIISALLAKAAGASSVYLLARKSSAARLELAASLGITTLLMENVESIEALKGHFDVSIDSTGNGDAINLAISLTRKLGRFLEFGISSTGIEQIALNEAMYKALSVYFSMSSEYSSWDRALNLMSSGKYDPSPLASLYSLDNWQDAFHDVENRSIVKGLITPKDFSDLDITE